MSDKKISQLTSLAQNDVVVSTDVLPIVDTSATETKKIAVNALVGAAAAAGLTNVDINSGTIDGATIATSDITVGSGKTLNVSAGTLTLADNQISGDKVEGGTINAITINTLTSTAVNATTVDATNVEVTNVKAKDGTAAFTIADSTGKVTVSTELAVDNITVSGNAITSTNTNGDIDLTPNGTGEVNITKVDIDSGAIDGTAIGANSASTGAFSTLSASGNVTLSGGTANGVLYLNGSKVATSGSALTFDTARLSFIKASNSRAWSPDGDDLFAIENSTSANADFRTSTTGATYLMFSDTDARARGYVAYLHGSDSMPFAVAGSESMRLTSTGLGIGTSSPAGKLEVQSNAAQLILSTATDPTNYKTTIRSVFDSANPFNITGVYNGTTADFIKITAGGGYTSPNLVIGNTMDIVSFNTGSTERMRLDLSGNLGLGVTPQASRFEVAGVSASATPTLYTFTAGHSAAITSFTAREGFQVISYQSVSGSPFTKTSALIANGDGTVPANMQFWTKASGSSSPSLAMTLDASGNLLVGKTVTTNTTPGIAISSGLYAATASSTSTNLATNNGAALNLINSSATDGNFSNIGAYNSNGLVVSQIDFINVSHASRTGDIAFLTHNGSSLLERARITSGGVWLVNTTSQLSSGSYGVHEIRGDAGSGGQSALVVYNTNASDASPAINAIKHSSTTTSSQRFIQFYANAGNQAMGGIVGNGTENAQFATISDVREKTNIQPVGGSLEKIVALKPVSFDWIKSGEHVKAGFVAQDVEQVFPEFVVENMANDGEEARKGLTGGMTGGIIAHLVAAIKDQQVMINELKAKVAALEAK